MGRAVTLSRIMKGVVVANFVLVVYLAYSAYQMTVYMQGFRQEFRRVVAHSNADLDATKAQIRELTGSMRGAREELLKFLMSKQGKR